jgi:hypothetical protein
MPYTPLDVCILSQPIWLLRGIRKFPILATSELRLALLYGSQFAVMHDFLLWPAYAGLTACFANRPINIKLLTILFGAILSASPAFASTLQDVLDGIDDIEARIDRIDLDQSKDDIQSDLDDVKQALEDLKGEQSTYVVPNNIRVFSFNDFKQPAPRAKLVKSL